MVKKNTRRGARLRRRRVRGFGSDFGAPRTGTPRTSIREGHFRQVGGFFCTHPLLISALSGFEAEKRSWRRCRKPKQKAEAWAPPEAEAGALSGTGPERRRPPGLGWDARTSNAKAREPEMGKLLVCLRPPAGTSAIGAARILHETPCGPRARTTL